MWRTGKPLGGPATIPEPFPPVVARATPCVHSQRLLLSQLVAVTSLSAPASLSPGASGCVPSTKARVSVPHSLLLSGGFPSVNPQ